MPYHFDNPGHIVYYNEADFAAKGLKNWEVGTSLTNDNWNVTYTFTRGKGFLAEVFPPKKFDEKIL